MDITRNILNWCDKQYKEAITDKNCKHPHVKSAVSGFVEGMVDGAVIMYPILVGVCIYIGKIKR